MRDLAEGYAHPKFLVLRVAPHTETWLSLEAEMKLVDAMNSGEMPGDWMAVITGYYSGEEDPPDPSDLFQGLGPTPRDVLEHLLDQLSEAGRIEP